MKSLARCDAVFVPGGDGSTQLHPADLFALTQQLHDAVRTVHNDTKFYVSLQQYAHAATCMQCALRASNVRDSPVRYSASNMSDAWAILKQDTYKGIISGMVYGPHTVRAVISCRFTCRRCHSLFAQDVSLQDFVASTPDAYDVRIYPDVCHTIYCQCVLTLYPKPSPKP